ncbi:MAG: hypothetical protein ABIJ16_09665 [Bacteroidota bacterium]
MKIPNISTGILMICLLGACNGISEPEQPVPMEPVNLPDSVDENADRMVIFRDCLEKQAEPGAQVCPEKA